mgnify:CR=1 FL=1
MSQIATSGVFGANALKMKKQMSCEFEKANESDSDFSENIDDFIDVDEEFGGASRAVKLSIRALNFNMMISDKQADKDPGTLRRISLLSRASSNAQMMQSGRSNNRTSILANKNYDRSSKLLNLYMQPTSNNGRDSCFYMAGIDEKEEFDQS